MTASEKNYRKALLKLERNNLRSLDLEAGDAISFYLDNGWARGELRRELTARASEHRKVLAALDKALTILKACPTFAPMKDV